VVAIVSFFPSTHWSVVLNAGNSGADGAPSALEQLCQTYWYPLYAYSRSLGDSPSDAEDLIQGFFVEILRTRFIVRADPSIGKFRSYLLKSFSLYRGRQIDRAGALKRGGGKTIISIDELEAEDRFLDEAERELPPEHRFDHEWAITILDQAHRRLEVEFERAGRRAYFERMRPFLESVPGGSKYSDLARELGKSEGAIKMEISRFRSRFRRQLECAVAETVGAAEDVGAELHYLLTLLRD